MSYVKAMTRTFYEAFIGYDRNLNRSDKSDASRAVGREMEGSKVRWVGCARTETKTPFVSREVNQTVLSHSEALWIGSRRLATNG